MISNTLKAGVGFYNRLSSIQLTFVQKAAFFLISTALLLVITATLLPYIDDIGVWGYVAAFVVTTLSSATVVMPSPGFAAVLLMAKDLNWLLLGISAGIGGALGEMTAYYIGTHGTETLEGHKSYEWFQRGMKRLGGPIILVSALVPLIPVDAAGLIAGAVRYPVIKFLVYLAIGKVVMTATLMFLSAKAFEWAAPYLEFFH
jgi:membrane protein YqaA with SNARE-associated domain